MVFSPQVTYAHQDQTEGQGEKAPVIFRDNKILIATTVRVTAVAFSFLVKARWD